jgi:hypothetical protein
MEIEFVNFYVSPWEMAGEDLDLKPGEYRSLINPITKERRYLVHAREYSPNRTKLCQKPRHSDNRFFSRSVPDYKKQEIDEKMREIGYRKRANPLK